ncbi:MAG: helix-turn-helix transcriptional regulator [Bacteroidales bacterium]|nr:helix-turn-helix transcriptional regulator [Bacteroidales bacterium]
MNGDKYSKLTPREKEILGFILFNPNYDECANDLCISRTTVKTHISNIFLKLGVSSLAELISKVFCSKYGLKLIKAYRRLKRASNQHDKDDWQM